MDLIHAALSDEALLADVRLTMTDQEGFHLWWLGQSGFLLQHAGKHLLFDPYLSDSLTRKYAATDKPHIRMSERTIDPRRLDMIDVVTSSHNHTDHLDGETLTCLVEANPNLEIVVPAANVAFAADRLELPEDRFQGADPATPLELSGFKLHTVPAAHESIQRDELGRLQTVGYVVEFGKWTLYHSGDTIGHQELLQALRPFSIDLALLPINGRAPERRVAGNLSGEEAVQFARAIGARCVIPCHFHMFTFNTADPDEEFCPHARRAGQPYRVLELGERFSHRELA